MHLLSPHFLFILWLEFFLYCILDESWIISPLIIMFYLWEELNLFINVSQLDLSELSTLSCAAQKATFLSGLSWYFHALVGHMPFFPILYFGNHHHLLLMKVSSEDGHSTF